MNILIIEPNPYLRNLYQTCLSKQKDINTVKVGADLVDALINVGNFYKLDSAVVNIDALVDVQSWALLRIFSWDMQIIGLSCGDNYENLLRAISAKVTGLLVSNISPNRLYRTLIRVAQGELCYDESLVNKIKTGLAFPDTCKKLECGNFIIDLVERNVLCLDRSIKLSQLEFDIFIYLVRNQGRVVSVCEMLEALWGVSPWEGGTSDQVWQCISRLRKKLRLYSSGPSMIKTVRGGGYKLEHD